jgi:flavin reductase (DIM6/NTAB) family NADH-FMN oxidoreductase RutF
MHIIESSSRAEAGLPFDSHAFRNALGTFPTGVAVITTLDGCGSPAGLTCNSFSSVSLEPPLVSWSMRKASRSIEVFRRTSGFTINVLADDQNEISGRFASSRISDKFAGVGWRPGHRGMPVIEGSLASFECETFAVHDAGDHLIFIGEVKRFEQGRQDEPLVFYKGAYMMLTQSLRDLVARSDTVTIDLTEARRRLFDSLLELACQAATDEDLDAIEAQIDRVESYVAAADIEKRMQAGVHFFRLLAAAAHNEVLAMVANSVNTMLHHALKSQIVELRRRAPSADLVNSAVIPLRRRLLAELRARNVEGAQAALAEFLAHSSLGKSIELPEP